MASTISTTAFIDSLGINTHLDFGSYGYQNIATVENAIRYLGLSNLRDSPANSGDLALWKQVAQATGAKFDAFIGETSPAGMSTDLNLISDIAKQGIINYIEGGNEEDDSYPASLGNNIHITAQFQQQVYALGQQLGLPVINMSFGAGWTAANNWQGDYGNVGDLSGVTNYANAHTYPGSGQTTGSVINRLNGLAHLAASARPVMTTEIGWDEKLGFSQSQVATYTLDAALDSMKAGDVKTYFYALFNDMSGNFGLMNPDGSPKPAGQALHNLTTLLHDSGGGFTPGTLNYTLNNAQSGDNTLLMEKSDGSYWLAVWNETAGAHAVTLSLGSAASQIRVFDPLRGTNAEQTVSNTGTITLTVPDHPVIVEIDGSGGATATTPTPAPAPTPSPTPTNAGTPDPKVTVPGTQTAALGQTVAIAGVSVADPWAASHPGTLALNVTASGGTVRMTDASGNAVAGSGTGAIHVSGSLAQINADLATLSYAAGSSGGRITVDAWDQGGAEGTRSFAVTATGSGTATTSGATATGSNTATNGAAGSTMPTVTIAPGDARPVEIVSNTRITASAGDHMIFVGGTGDVLTATGGTNTVMAFQGANRITTGTGNDTIRYAGTNNLIDAGAGQNVLQDSGSNSTIVLPGANQGLDAIYGNMMQNGDRFDLRHALASTGWQGDLASIGNFIKVATHGNTGVVSLNPTGAPGGASYAVANLEGSGPLTLDTLLAHSIT